MLSIFKAGQAENLPPQEKRSLPMATKYHHSNEQILLEEEQITAAKADPALFEPLYNKYYEPIFRFVYQRLNDKDTAFDITSQVFLKAMSNLQRYAFKGLPFSSWLYRIAQNELTQLFRDNKSKRTVNVETPGLFKIVDEMEEQWMDDYEEGLAKCLAQLPEGELQLIEMRYFEHRHFKEIGEILGITENNAKVKLYRLLEKLKKQITQRS